MDPESQPKSQKPANLSKPGTLVMGLSLLDFMSWAAAGQDDPRAMVELPDPMRHHMLTNMRDHLAAINEILDHLGNDQTDKAAEVAEFRLGMSLLQAHGAEHMARFMPEGMRAAGTHMHRAASRFALVAQEGEAMATCRSLSELTSACVACHAGYRVH